MQRLAVRKPFRRDTNRIKQWVLEQRGQRHTPQDSPPDSESPDSAEPPSPSSGCHPYLAYPHLPKPPSLKTARKDVSSAILNEDTDDVPRLRRDAFTSTKVCDNT